MAKNYQDITLALAGICQSAHMVQQLAQQGHCQPEALTVSLRSVLTEHLSLYFKYFDSDYGDLKKLLNMEPLQITVLKYGTIAAYEKKLGERLSRINPGMLDIIGLLKQQAEPYAREKGGGET